VRRILTFGLAWLAAAVLASVVAWQGVSLIGAQVTDSRPETLSAGEIDAELAEATATSERPTGATDGSTTAPTDDTRGGDPNGADPASTPTTTPPTTAAAAERQTVSMVGGTAAFEFSDGTVHILYATPNPGYRSEIDEGHDGGIRVEFEGNEGTSRVDAWWDGRPQIRTDDHGEHGGDDDRGEGGGGD
jgi:hypothetical protein